MLLEQGFLKPRRGKPVHGVELFRLRLFEQMLALGVRISVAAEASWEPILRERIQDERLALRLVKYRGNAWLTGLSCGLKTRGAFDALLIGNPRRGLVPGIYAALAVCRPQRRLVLAHRRPEGAIRWALRPFRLNVMANSEHVAGPWRKATRGWTRIMYGLPNVEAFHPPAPEEKPDDGVLRFCLLGKLPSNSKGSEDATAAFAALPDAIRRRSELHLASFITEPPPDLPAGVVAHRWVAPEDVPALLRRMDILLAPSTDETFSQAIVQGMLTGLPVVSSDLDVFTEKLDTGGGIITPMRDREALREGMIALAEDPERRREMGRIARQTALERYVWSTERFMNEILFPDAPTPSPAPA